MLSGVATMQRALIIAVVILLLFAVIATYIIGHNIAKPLIAIKEDALRLSKLDLTQDIDPKVKSRKDEVGILGMAFQEILDNLRNVLSSVQDSSEIVSASSEELTATSQQSVKTMESVAIILDEQGQKVLDTKEKYKTIEKAIKDSESGIEKLNVSGIEMEEKKQEILDALQNLSAIAEENSAATQEISASVEEQASSAEEISSASDGLASLAEDLHQILKPFKVE